MRLEFLSYSLRSLQLKSVAMKQNSELVSTTFVGGLRHLPIR